MKKILLVLPLFALLFIQVSAQEEITYSIPRWHLGIEVGVNPLYGGISPFQPNIRQSSSYYPDYDNDYYGGFVRWGGGNLTSFSFGIKPEYLIKKRLALVTGLRFNFFTATLNSDRDFFLWKLSETETSAHYVKINNISQRNYYLEIPLEVKLFPREKDYAVRQYFIFGTAFNFLVASITDVQFQNPKMDKYASKVLEKIGDPNFFQGSVYAGVGIKFGKLNYPCGSIEIHCPVISYGNGKKHTFANTVNIPSIRIHTTLQIPVSKKNKLTYTVID
jgi:hypothetical protein